jgi:hypothetical protein
MKSVALIEGFAGGPLHTREFRESLEKAGFKVIKDKKRADVVIAHSAGCYAVPKDAKADLLMLIGPPYWPQQPVTKRFVKHLKSSKDFAVRHYGWKYFFQKKALEIYYSLVRHKYLWLGLINHKRLDFLIHSDKNIILIRNKDDPFCSPEIKKVVERLKNIKYVELPGVHDDYVKNPQPYIDLLLQAI